MDLIEQEKILLEYAADYIYEHESKLEIKYWKMGIYGKSSNPAKPFRREYKSLNELMDFIDFIDDHVQRSSKIPEYRRFDYDFMGHIKTLVDNFKQARKDAALNSTIAPEGKPNDSIVPKQRPAALNVLFTTYPEFEKDFALLMSKGYMAELEDGDVKWLKSKKSLAEYFGYQTAKSVEWKFIEPAFGETGLKYLFSKNGNAYEKKHSRDYEDWLKSR
jgi:hypothetical protein